MCGRLHGPAPGRVLQRNKPLPPSTLPLLPAPLAGHCWRAPPRDLLAWAAATDACSEPDTCALCLRALAQRLQGLGPSWEAGLPRGLLAADLRLAARLLRGLLASCDPARGVVSVRDGAGGGVGGFTWVLSAFSTHPGEVSSPWVAVGGSEWRLDIYPRGNRNSNGEHLSGGWVGR